MALDYYRLVEEYTQAAPCILIEYFKMVFLNIYNYTYKTPFRKSSHTYRTSDDTSIGIKANFVVSNIITLLIVTFLALVVCVAYNFCCQSRD